ncbi:TetR/AcrR family transcriptional regulator [Rhodococcus sp. NPDC003382]
MSPDDVLAAARSFVQRKGIAALTLVAVAREAHISRATMYRRFPSRNALVEALIDAELGALEEVVRGRVDVVDDPRATVRALVRDVLEHLARNAPLQAALRIDGSVLVPWLIRRGDSRTLVDIVTDRALTHVAGSALAPHLHPEPAAAVEFIVAAIYAELLSPARHLTHEQIADNLAAAVVR